MQRDGDVSRGWVGDLVEPDLVVNVGHFVGGVGGGFDEGGPSAGGWGGRVQGFLEGAFEDFHDAVGVGVVVDGAAFSRVWGD